MKIDAKISSNNHTIQAQIQPATGGAAATRVVQVTLLASAWTGAASRYSQVINVDRATKYSKVDLQPSVEQLEIFHDKDIAFTTENEDGVITAFAIGDKPTMSYTIQATVTEVKA